MTTLVIFVFSKRKNDPRTMFDENLRFFIKYGLVQKEGVDYYLIVNGPQEFLQGIDGTEKFTKVIHRENQGGDFGGWGHILNTDTHWDRYICINDTTRGPFLPRWSQGHWTDLFLSKLNSKKNNRLVKLVGPTENHAFYKHIQSYCFGTDKETMDFLINKCVFLPFYDYNDDKFKIIMQHEIGMSKHIIENGWEIYSFLIRQEKFPINSDMQYLKGWYYGISVNPFELMFMKSTSQTPEMYRYTEWLL